MDIDTVGLCKLIVWVRVRVIVGLCKLIIWVRVIVGLCKLINTA